MTVLYRYACLLVVTAGCSLSQTAQIKGFIHAEDGTAVAGRRVTLTRTRPTAFTTEVITAKDGSFDASGLPAGSYRICPEAVDDQTVSPCMWRDASTVISLQDNQSVPDANIVLRQGVSLQVEVADQAGLTKSGRDARGEPRMLFLAVRGPHGPTYPLVPSSRHGASVTYRLTIPYDVNLRLIVRPFGLDVADSQNNILPESGKIYQFLQPKLAPNLTANKSQPNFQFIISPKGK